jgi:hypothetical protein
MHIASYFISPNNLWEMIGTAQSPLIVDTPVWPAKVA